MRESGMKSILLNLWAIFNCGEYGLAPAAGYIKFSEDINFLALNLIKGKSLEYVIEEDTYTPLLHFELIYIVV